MVWQEDDAVTGNQDIFFKKSTDNGNSFGPVNNLSRTDGDSLPPQILYLRHRKWRRGGET